MNCEACPFKGQVKVYGEGSRVLGEHQEEETFKNSNIVFKKTVVERDNDGQYDIVFVGMAPAEEEEKQERPMVGVSGQILRGTAKQMGIEEFYICNILLCPIKDDSLVPQALKCCRNVIEEIKERKPKLTIALGDLPLSVLAPDIKYTIKEVEGRVIPSEVGPLLPLTHPAYYWRRPDEFFDFLECMRSGLKFLSGKYAQAVEPTSTIVTPDNLYDILNELDKHEEVAVDLETTGFNAYGWEPNKVLEMGISCNHEHAYIVPAEMIPEFKEILEKKKGIYWNAQFDCGFLKQIGINANADFDGMLAHYSIDERGYSHGLKRVAGRYLGCDDWEEKIGDYIPRGNKSLSYEVIPTEIRYEYLAKDVTRTFQLKAVLWDDVNHKVFDRLLMPGCRMFIEIENRGMRVDPVKLMQMEEILLEDLDKLEDELHELTGDWINPRSSKQVKELVYGKMGIPIDPFFGPSTGKEALEPYSDNPVIANILDQRSISHTKGNYVEGFARFVDHNYRIHPKINLFKAVTGRLSSEEPSIMNIKSESRLKEMFLPDPGHLLGYGDIKGNELRWYCISSGDPELTAILKSIPTPDNPRANDPHYWVALAAYGAEKADELRTPAKAVVFGRIYKRGRKSIEYQVGSEVIDAVMEAVDSIAPNIDKYYKGIMEELKQGYLISYFGRKRRFPLITPKTRHHVEREAVNFKPQSGGSDLMLLCMLHLFEIKDRWGIWPFWPVHDSITSDIPDKSILPEMKKELEEYSNDVVGGAMPFVWKMDWGYDWSMSKEPPKGKEVTI